MDDDDGPYTASQGDSLAAGVSCDVCGSTKCIVNDTGDVVCILCGAQSQDQRVLEDEEQLGDETVGVRTGRGGTIFRVARVQRATALPAAADAFTMTAFLRALQRLLSAQVRDLVKQCGAPPELRSAVGDAWGRYLARWVHSEVPPVAVLNGRLVYGTAAAYYAKLRSDGLTPASNVPCTMPLTLSILYVACRSLSLAILPHDLAAWVRNGTLAYINAFGLVLTREEQVTLSAARSFFSPSRPPTVTHISRLAVAFAHNVGVVLPRLNVALCAARLVNTLRLPVDCVPFTQQLLALDELDSERGGAVGTVTPAQARKRSRNAAEGGSTVAATGTAARDSVRALRRDEFYRRRRSAGLDRNSADYVGAIVFVSCRLVRGWTQWVDAHLAPGCVGDIATARARLGRASGTWFMPPRDRMCTCSNTANSNSGRLRDSSSSSAPPPLNPDVPLPTSSADAASLPAALLPAWVVWAGRSVLTGGDLAAGRGEDGYADATAPYRPPQRLQHQQQRSAPAGGGGNDGAIPRVRIAERAAVEAFAEFSSAAQRARDGGGAAAAGIGNDAIDPSLLALLAGGASDPLSSVAARSGAGAAGDTFDVTLRGRAAANTTRRSRASHWGTGGSVLADVAATSASLRAWGLAQLPQEQQRAPEDDCSSGTAAAAVAPSDARDNGANKSPHADTTVDVADARLVAPSVVDEFVMMPSERQAAMLGRPLAPRPPYPLAREESLLQMVGASLDCAPATIAAHADFLELLLQHYA